jgi:hypothetical protein
MSGRQSEMVAFFLCSIFQVKLKLEWSSVRTHPGFLKASDNCIIRYTIKFIYFPKVCYLFFWEYVFIIVYLHAETYELGFASAAGR